MSALNRVRFLCRVKGIRNRYTVKKKKKKGIELFRF